MNLPSLTVVRRTVVRRRPRRGLSLLEVIVSLAILGASLSALGVLVHLGMRAAAGAREGTTAQIIAESLLNEVTAGSLPAESVSQAQYDEYWLYSINIAPIQNPPLPLVEVRVLVEQYLPEGGTPHSYEVVRWMPDPTVESPADAAAVVVEEDAGAEGLEF